MSTRLMVAQVVLLSLIGLYLTVPSIAQTSTGSITGYVQDATGAVIPGVSVTLSSEGIIGGNQQTVTNERGTYEFNGLLPGTYSVKTDLTGFKPSLHQNLTVKAAASTRVDIQLEVGTVGEEITVSGEAEALLDTSSALVQSVLDRTTLDTLPTGHDVWSIGRTVPGVVLSNYDIGGNQSFQQATFTVHGSTGADNKYAIDGLDVAWANGAGTVMVYFDPDSFEEMNYGVNNASAENRSGGVVTNMISKTGTNVFHGSYQFTGTNKSLQGNNISPALNQQLSLQIPANVLAANPNIRPGQQILSLFDTSASLSGPVVKDKMWFTATYKIASLNQYILANYNPNGTQGLDDNRIFNATFKLSYQLTHNSQLHYSFIRNLTDRYHRRTTTFQSDQAAADQLDQADIHQLKWTETLSAKAVVDAGVSLQVGPFPELANQQALAAAAAGLFPEVDASTGASTVMNSSYFSEPQYRIASTYNLSYFAGHHEIKTGYQFDRMMNRNATFSIVNYPGLPGIPFTATYNNGAPISVSLYNYPSDSRTYAQQHGFFVQDKWNVSRRLTLNEGIRFDFAKGWLPQLCQPTTAVIAGQCFTPLSSPQIPNLFSVAPRFAFVYDVSGDGRTAIKGSANIYPIGIDASYANTINPYKAATNTVSWVVPANVLAAAGVNGTNTAESLGLGPTQSELAAFNFNTKQCVTPVIPGLSCSGFTFGSTNLFDPNLKRPFTFEWTLGLQRELPGGWAVSAIYTQHDVWRTMGTLTTSLNLLDYTPVTITIPNTSQVETFYNILPADNALTTCTGVGPCIVTGNHSDRAEYFKGLDLTGSKRMSNNWTISAGLSFNHDWHRVPFRTDTPNANLFAGGPTTSNVPVEFKMNGIYRAPLGMEIAGNFQVFSGKPLPAQTYQITRALVPTLTPTTLTINTANVGFMSYPKVVLLDTSVGREFRFEDGKLRVTPKMEIFNLNNSAAVQTESTLLNGTGANTYLNPSSILSPRMLKLGLKANF